MEWAEWTNEKKLHAGWFVCYVYVMWAESVMLGGIMDIYNVCTSKNQRTHIPCLPFITREVKIAWMDGL